MTFRFEPVELRPFSRPYLGLGLWRTQRWAMNHPQQVALPFGWRYLKVESRSACVALPLWLYWPIRLWRARWDWCETLMMSGFWFMPEDGGWYKDGHFTLRIWTSFDHMRNGCSPLWKMPREQFPAPINRWEALGWWIEERIADFNAQMPRWA